MMGLFDDLKKFFKQETVKLHPDTIRQLSASRAEYRPKGVLTFEPVRGTRHPELETPLKTFTNLQVYGAPTAVRVESTDPDKYILGLAGCSVSLLDVGVPGVVLTPLSFRTVSKRSEVPLIWNAVDNIASVPPTVGHYWLYTPGHIKMLPIGHAFEFFYTGAGEDAVVALYYYEIERG